MPPTLLIDYEFSHTLTASTRWGRFNQTLRSSGTTTNITIRLATRIRAAGRLLEHAIIPGTGLVCMLVVMVVIKDQHALLLATLH